MKNHSKQSGRRIAFTIVELLTVISIIAILIGILVPSLRAVRRTAREVKQKTQLHALDTALEAFRAAYGDYPPSNLQDEDDAIYGGAFKLAEAMVGQDLLGFDIRSRWRADLSERIDGAGTPLYSGRDRESRLGPYIELKHANAYEMRQLYSGVSAPFLKKRYVICDVFSRAGKIGMPILYYKANTFNKSEERPHDPNKYGEGELKTQTTTNIYNYYDCLEIIGLGVPPGGAKQHPMFDPTSVGQTTVGIRQFYNQTRNLKVKIWNQTLLKYEWWPYNAESFILISAGPDGLYGTPDDLGNYKY